MSVHRLENSHSVVGLYVPWGCAFMEKARESGGVGEEGRGGCGRPAVLPSAGRTAALESAADGRRRPIKFNFLPQMPAGKQSDD